MNSLSLLTKLVIVLLIATTMRRARATLRVRRVDELEQITEYTP